MSDFDRLDPEIKPVNYDIFFEPDLKKFEFKGVEVITVKSGKRVKQLRLNSKDLKIEQAWVNNESATVKLDGKNEIAVLTFKKPLEKINKVKLAFSGKNSEIHGFYKSSYRVDGEQRYMLSTQFEPADARSAFPCFDEPSFKATFNLSLLVEEELMVISNTVIEKSEKIKGKKLVVFKKTPVMSSYLLYFGIGEFEKIEGFSGRTKVSVYVTPGKIGYAKLPLDYALKALKLYEKYFGLKYQLEKLDLIGIPDFSAGAMENWGAITFRETALLCNDKTPISERQGIANTIVHELAHQWFGDLVTMKWWDDLWLNESFATFMSYKIVDEMFPEWDTMLRYMNGIVAGAFSADSLKSTHAINCVVKRPGDIDELFDDISYEKGGSILKMIEGYLGEETFRLALHDYLTRHAYGNASKEDLWNSFMKEAVKRRIQFNTGMISQWIDKPGHPVIMVEPSENGFYLKQELFTLLKNGSGNWNIPVQYKTDKGEGRIVVKKEGSFIKSKAEWVKLNLNGAGFYRVFYSKPLLEKLGAAFRQGRISTLDAWSLENDLFVQARTGRVKLTEYLDFVRKFFMNSEYPLNSSVSNHLAWFFVMTYGERNGESVKSLVIDFHERMLEKIGWDKRKGERNINTILRGKAVASLGLAGNEKALKKASDVFELAFNGRKCDPDLKAAAYALKSWAGNSKLLGKMIEKYEKEDFPEESARLLNSMGMIGDVKALSEALDYSQTERVRLQDSFRIPMFASGNPEGKKLIWGWTRKNWKILERKNKMGTHSLHHYVDNLSGLSDRKSLREVEVFFKKNKRGDIKRAVVQVIERINANINFRKANDLQV